MKISVRRLKHIIKEVISEDSDVTHSEYDGDKTLRGKHASNVIDQLIKMGIRQPKKGKVINVDNSAKAHDQTQVSQSVTVSKKTSIPGAAEMQMRTLEPIRRAFPALDSDSLEQLRKVLVNIAHEHDIKDMSVNFVTNVASKLNRPLSQARVQFHYDPGLNKLTMFRSISIADVVSDVLRDIEDEKYNDNEDATRIIPSKKMH